MKELLRFSKWLSYQSQRFQRRLARRLAWAVVCALVLSLLPWHVPSLREATAQRFADAPAAVQGLVPLALSISGWADRVLSSVGPAVVYAGDSITLTLSKRDDGPPLGDEEWAPGPDPVTPGSELVYYIQITNTGSITATVFLTDDLPAELTWTGYKILVDGGANWIGGEVNDGSQAVFLTLDSVSSTMFNGLGPGQTAILAIRAVVSSSLADGHVFVNTSDGYAAYAEQEMAYLYAGAVDVETTVSAPELSIDKSVWPAVVEAGEELTLTLSISNSGSLTLTAPFTLTVVDEYPTGTDFVRQTPFPNASQETNDGSSFTWVIPFDGGGDPDLAPGETIQAELVLEVDSPFTHTARVTNTTYSVSVSPSDLVVPPSASGAAVGVEVHSHPTLTIAKSDAPDPVYADQTWAYRITVGNDAGAQGNAVGIVITDRVPMDTVLQTTDFAVPGTMVQTEGTAGGSLITWTLPADFSLLWGESTEVSFTVSSVATVVDGATVITNAEYGVTADNALAPVPGVAITTTVIGEPDLALDKTPDGVSFVPGEVITYWIHYTNTVDATANATGLVITDVLPGNIGGGSADPAPSAGTIAAGETVTWTSLSSLAPGESDMITVTLTTDAVIDDDMTLLNSTTVNSSAGIGASDTGSYVADSTPVLHIVKTSDPSPVVRTGGTLTYTIVYSNSGSMVATGVEVVDTIDPNLTVLSTDPVSTSMAGQDITWAVGGLFPDGPRTITVVAQVVGVLPSGSLITNTAQISCAQGLSAQTGDVTNTVQSPDLQITKTGPAAEVRVGELLTFTISFTNTGQGPAQDVTITDTLPVSLTVDSLQQAGVTYDGQVGSSHRWVASSIAPGAGGTITVTARPTTTGSWVDADGVALQNNVVASVDYDSNLSDNTAQAPVTVVPGEVAYVTMTVSPQSTAVPNAVNLAITATDAYGNPMWNADGHTVALDSDPSGLNFAPGSVSISDGTGAATADTTLIGTYEITATLSGPSTVTDTALVTFTAGALAGFDIATIGQQTAGISFTVSITAVDAYDNPIDDFSSTVPLADDAPVDTLLPDTVVFSGGRATTYVTITLARLDEILVGSGLTETSSNSFEVVAGAPATVTVSADPIEVPSGVDGTATAEVVDAYGNLVEGDGLTFGISAGTVDPAAGTTNAAGEATSAFSHTVPSTASIVVTASNGVTGSVVVTFIAGCANSVSVAIAPASLAVGGSATITVHVQDTYGNDVDWATVDLNTSDDLGSGSIDAPSLALDASGQATTTVSSTASGVKAIQATVFAERGCGTASGSGNVTFDAGEPDDVQVTMTPNPQTAGSDATLQATVTDGYNNPVAGVLVTFSVPAGALGGGGIDPLFATTDVSGVATASISSTIAGSTSLTATVNATVDDVETISFVAGDPAGITLTVSPGTVDGGVDATLVATVTDAYGNPCVGSSVSFVGDPSAGLGISPNPSTVGAGGQATALISGTVSGSVIVTATADSGVEDGTTLTINSGLLDHLETSLVPDPLTAGVNFTLYVTATDSVGTMRNDSGTVNMADLTGSMAPTTVNLTNGWGSVVISITQARVDDIIWLEWAQDFSVIGSSNRFTVTAGAPYTVLLTATPGSISPGGETSAIAATVEDVYGNPVPDQTVSFDLVSAPAGTTVMVDSGTTNAAGQASATVTSGNDQGTATVEATCGSAVNQVDVDISTFLVYLPVVMRNYTGIDLLVQDIQVVDAGGQYEIEVTIENVGHNTVSADFWVDLYIDPSSPPVLNDLWNDLGTYGKAWFVRQSVGPGQQIVLSTSDPDDPASPGDRYSNWPGSFTTGTHELYAQVDSYGVPNIGAVIEYNESNNVYGPSPYVALGGTMDGSEAGDPLDPRPTPVP